jgi:hypothetical protein
VDGGSRMRIDFPGSGCEDRFSQTNPWFLGNLNPVVLILNACRWQLPRSTPSGDNPVSPARPAWRIPWRVPVGAESFLAPAS